MDVFACALFAYVLCGISRVLKDLSINGITRPLWALEPTLGRAVLVVIGWPVRPIAEAYASSRQIARSVVFGLLSIVTQMIVLTGYIWLSHEIAKLAFDNFILEIILTVVIAVFGAFIAIPIGTAVLTPIIFLVSIPLNFLFPLKNTIRVDEMQWCRTCKHHKYVEKYEDPTQGLWLAETMPLTDSLPCKIVHDTSHVWVVHYKTECESRTLFPENCHQYERPL